MASNECKSGPVDVNYSTFWNDFSHYSLYQQVDDRQKGVDYLEDTPI